MSNIESFAYSCLPALLILIFSEVAVFLAEGKVLAMSILGLLYLILVWWLYQFTRGKVVICEEKDEQSSEIGSLHE